MGGFPKEHRPPKKKKPTEWKEKRANIIFMYQKQPE